MTPATKACSSCTADKPIEEFGVRRDRRDGDGRDSRCKECRRIEARRRRAENPERYKAVRQQWLEETADRRREQHRAWRARNRDKERAYQRKRRERYKRFLDAAKETAGCIDCGATVDLHFDHVQPGKRFHFAHAWEHSWSEVIAELELCEVRCSSCHALRHASTGENRFWEKSPRRSRVTG